MQEDTAFLKTSGHNFIGGNSSDKEGHVEHNRNIIVHPSTLNLGELYTTTHGNDGPQSLYIVPDLKDERELQRMVIGQIYCNDIISDSNNAVTNSITVSDSSVVSDYIISNFDNNLANINTFGQLALPNIFHPSETDSEVALTLASLGDPKNDKLVTDGSLPTKECCNSDISNNDVPSLLISSKSQITSHESQIEATDVNNPDREIIGNISINGSSSSESFSSNQTSYNSKDDKQCSLQVQNASISEYNIEKKDFTRTALDLAESKSTLVLRSRKGRGTSKQQYHNFPDPEKIGKKKRKRDDYRSNAVAGCTSKNGRVAIKENVSNNKDVFLQIENQVNRNETCVIKNISVSHTDLPQIQCSGIGVHSTMHDNGKALKHKEVHKKGLNATLSYVGSSSAHDRSLISKDIVSLSENRNTSVNVNENSVHNDIITSNKTDNFNIITTTSSNDTHVETAAKISMASIGEAGSYTILHSSCSNYGDQAGNPAVFCPQSEVPNFNSSAATDLQHTSNISPHHSSLPIQSNANSPQSFATGQVLSYQSIVPHQSYNTVFTEGSASPAHSVNSTHQHHNNTSVVEQQRQRQIASPNPACMSPSSSIKNNDANPSALPQQQAVKSNVQAVELQKTLPTNISTTDSNLLPHPISHVSQKDNLLGQLLKASEHCEPASLIPAGVVNDVIPAVGYR